MEKEYVSATNKDPYVVLYYREFGELKNELKRVDWYFGILKTDSQKVPVQMKINQLKTIPDKNEKIIKTVDRDEYTLIYCSRFSQVPLILKQMGIQTFEDDLSPVQRFWLDNTLKLSEKYKIAFFDIETEDVNEIRIGQDKILSFAIVDDMGEEFFYSLKDVKNEKELLQKFIEVANNYDMLVGWNSWKFDMPYLTARMTLFGIRWFDQRRISHIDLQQRMIHSYRFDTRLKSFSLDYIAKRFLKEGKVKRTEKVIDLFKSDYETFREYNLNDARLLYKLEKQNKIIEVLIRQAIWCNTFPRDISPTGKSLYRLLDNLVLTNLHQRKKLAPAPKYSKEAIKKMTEQELKNLEYPGGYVSDPKKGVHDNVYTFDFKSLYPSMMRTWNIGYDTLTNKTENTFKNPAGTYFLKEPKSTISIILEFLLEKRKEFKQRILKLVEENKTNTPEYEAAHADEVVVKELSNSMYGIQGKKDGRYFSKETASSITLAGQWVVKSLQKFIEMKNYEFLYSDTDSAMIEAKGILDVESFLKEFQEWLLKELKDNWGITESVIQLEFDRYFKRFVLVDKKTYTGLVLNQEGKKTDYVYIRGLETIKSSSCNLAVRLQEELINKLLKEDYNKEYYKGWLLEKKESILKDVKADDLILTTKVNKKFDQYKNKTLPVFLAEKKLKREGILLDREIQYIVTSTIPKLDGVEPQFWDGKFDKEYYWDRALLPCCDRLLRVAFPDIAWKQDYKTEKKTRQQKLL
jgi:DNA polymerase elongation subunit (family B)